MKGWIGEICLSSLFHVLLYCKQNLKVHERVGETMIKMPVWQHVSVIEGSAG